MRRWLTSAPPTTIALLIVLFFIIDRALGAGFLLPEFCNEDERWIRDGAVKMVQEASLDPGTHKYPELMFFLTAAVYESAYLAANFSALPHFESRPSFSWHRAHYAFDFAATVALGRMLVAALGAVSLLVFYRLARREYGEEAALPALLLFATAPAWLFSTLLLKPDALLVMGVLLTVSASLKLLASGKSGDYVWAGLAVGLCLAAKYHIAAIVPVLFAHRLHHHELSLARAFRQPRWLISLAAALLAFALLSPITWLDFQGAFEQGALELTLQRADPLLLRSSERWWHLPILFQFLAALPLALGIPMYLLSLVGIFRRFDFADRRALVFWSYPAGFIAFMILMSDLGAPHLYTTAAPFFALAAAKVVAPWMGMPSRMKRAGAVILIGLLAAYNLFFFHSLTRLEDTIIRDSTARMEQTHQAGQKDLGLVPYYPNPDRNWTITFLPQFMLSPSMIAETAPDRILIHHAYYNAYLDNPELMNNPPTAAMMLFYLELRAGKAGFREADRWTGESLTLRINQALMPDLGGMRVSVYEKRGP